MLTRGRVDRFLDRHPLTFRGISLSRLALRFGQRFLDVRVMGLSAEMSYYALLSFLPLVGAIGASLGFIERLLGPEDAAAAEAAILGALDAVFSREMTADVWAPLVAGLLQEERGGFAVGSFLVTLFLASRIFRSAIDTLDSAYHVEERRSVLALWSLGLLFALAAVVAGTAIVTMVVVGPLLGGGRAVAAWFGLGAAFEFIWRVLRWPVVFAFATGFLSFVYRFGPNAHSTWRGSLPGAVFGMFALVLVAVGFRVYVEVTGLQSPAIQDADDAVAVALQFFGALMAALLWLWLSGMAILSGGLLNAELTRLRREPPVA
jgi:membrane protein